MKTTITAIAITALVSFSVNAATQVSEAEAYLNYEMGYEGEGQRYTEGKVNEVYYQCIQSANAILSNDSSYEGQDDVFFEGTEEQLRIAIADSNKNISSAADPYFNYGMSYESENQIYFRTDSVEGFDLKSTSITRNEGYEGEGEIFSNDVPILDTKSGIAFALKQF